MLIDWFTVLAQAVNFLILVWLLKRFLYKPALATIDTREKAIAAQLAGAAARMAEAIRERDELRKQNEALQAQREQLLFKATEAADAEHRRLLEIARKDSDDLRSKLAQTLATQQIEAKDTIVTAIRKEVFAIARQALADLADTNLENRMAEIFVRRLRELRAKNVLDLSAVSSTPALVRSAFELATAQRISIEEALRVIFGTDRPIHFETHSGLLSGVELIVDGHRIAWSLGDYLTSLAEHVTVLFGTEPPQPVPAIDVQHAA